MSDVFKAFAHVRKKHVRVVIMFSIRDVVTQSQLFAIMSCEIIDDDSLILSYSLKIK